MAGGIDDHSRPAGHRSPIDASYRGGSLLRACAPAQMVLASPAIPGGPISILLLPVVRLEPALLPTAILKLPVLLFWRAETPFAVLSWPVVSAARAKKPFPVFCCPYCKATSLPTPKTRSAAHQIRRFSGDRLRLLILSRAGSARSGTVIAKKDVDFTNNVGFNGQDPISRSGRATGSGAPEMQSAQAISAAYDFDLAPRDYTLADGAIELVIEGAPWSAFIDPSQSLELIFCRQSDWP